MDAFCHIRLILSNHRRKIGAGFVNSNNSMDVIWHNNILVNESTMKVLRDLPKSILCYGTNSR